MAGCQKNLLNVLVYFPALICSTPAFSSRGSVLKALKPILKSAYFSSLSTTGYVVCVKVCVPERKDAHYRKLMVQRLWR